MNMLTVTSGQTIGIRARIHKHGEMLLYYQLRGESEWLGRCIQVVVGMWGMEDMYHWGWGALRRETKYRKPFLKT